jgi:hypothetical protein
MNRFSRAPYLVAVVVIAAVMLQGCEPALEELRWTETVALGPGDTVAVERRIVYLRAQQLSEKEAFIDLSESFLTIRSERDPTPTLPLARLTPIRLERDVASGDVIVIAGTDDCDQWRNNGEPNPRYWGFRLHEGTWYRIDFRSEWIDRPANLLIDYRVDDEETIKAEDVAVRRAMQLDNGEYAISLRTVLGNDPNKLNCGHGNDGSTELDFSGMGRM